MKPFIFIVLAFALFVLGVVAGNVFFSQNSPSCNQTFTYINPKLNCGIKQVISKANPIELKARLTAFIAGERDAGRAEEVAIYFRDLQDGPILGINENQEFISASLLKLPITMTFYRLAEEEQPNILSKRLRFIENMKAGDELSQFFKPIKTIQPGTYYTVEDLIYNSLVYSDNLSSDVLKSALVSIALERDLLLETYRDLGLVLPTSITQTDISTRLYSTIFRILYNASYLSTEHSEKILSMLAESKFDEGIANGVPKDVRVANKFGERYLGEKKQLHDCGIVYYPGNPYLLCVMTRGSDFSILARVIAEISRMTYEDIDAKRL